MKTTIEIDIPNGKEVVWKKNDEGNTYLALVDKEKPKKITERIKTFEDAIVELGAEHPLVTEYTAIEKINGSKDLLAYLKLRIIAAALNEGWEPQFTTDEYRYYPWFYLYTEEEINSKSEEWKKKHKVVLWGGLAFHGADCGLAFAFSSYAFSHSVAGGSGLALR